MLCEDLLAFHVRDMLGKAFRKLFTGGEGSD